MAFLKRLPPGFAHSVLDVEDLKHFVAVVVDHLDGNLAGLRWREGARASAVERVPRLFVDLGSQRPLQSGIGVRCHRRRNNRKAPPRCTSACPQQPPVGGGHPVAQQATGKQPPDHAGDQQHHREQRGRRHGGQESHGSACYRGCREQRPPVPSRAALTDRSVSAARPPTASVRGGFAVSWGCR